ncbi:hypothetical protein BS78_05G111300 [Paspalum vaginatum]|nr:hypothetical protein BS78_05G111300 [Paspalum vaginatum]
MAAVSQTTKVPTDAELLQAQADLWRHSLYYLTSMALKCAVELSIQTAIHNLGGAASLQDLVNALSLPKTKLPFLGRLMRLLVTSGIFMSGEEEETYRLNPLSWLLVDGAEAEDHGYQKYFVIGTNSQKCVEAALSLADWFKKDLAMPPPSPFEDLHGVPIYHDDTPKLLGEDFDSTVTKGLAAHDNFAIATTIRECIDLFKGLQSLTDCCGGDGTTVRAIVKAFPGIKCTVLDLPKVIEKAPADDAIKYVAGDMFDFIPPAQAVLLKLVLHFWNDEDCVKILEQCRKAIPSRQEGGKVIIIEVVLGYSMGPIMYEAQVLLDMAMMVSTRGRQRGENEWRDIFMKAGFSDYKIVRKIGARAFIEVYP